MKNSAKEKLKKNELCLGVGLRQSRTVDIGKIMATCDYDWLFIDMEHNSMDIDIASQISVAAQDAGITPIVRVPDFAHHHATRVLDCGAMGIVFPHVENAKTAEKLVSFCLFPPKGHRSMTGLLPQLDFNCTIHIQWILLLDLIILSCMYLILYPRVLLLESMDVRPLDSLYVLRTT